MSMRLIKTEHCIEFFFRNWNRTFNKRVTSVRRGSLRLIIQVVWNSYFGYNRRVSFSVWLCVCARALFICCRYILLVLLNYFLINKHLFGSVNIVWCVEYTESSIIVLNFLFIVFKPVYRESVTMNFISKFQRYWLRSVVCPGESDFSGQNCCL